MRSPRAHIVRRITPSARRAALRATPTHGSALPPHHLSAFQNAVKHHTHERHESTIDDTIMPRSLRILLNIRRSIRISIPDANPYARYAVGNRAPPTLARSARMRSAATTTSSPSTAHSPIMASTHCHLLEPSRSTPASHAPIPTPAAAESIENPRSSRFTESAESRLRRIRVPKSRRLTNVAASKCSPTTLSGAMGSRLPS